MSSCQGAGVSGAAELRAQSSSLSDILLFHIHFFITHTYFFTSQKSPTKSKKINFEERNLIPPWKVLNGEFDFFSTTHAVRSDYLSLLGEESFPGRKNLLRL